MIFSISSIDIKCPLNVFQSTLQDIIDDIDNNTGTSSNYSINETSTRSGNTLYDVKVTNSIGEFRLLAHKESNGDVRFEPLQLHSVNNSFYSLDYNDFDKQGTDEDPAEIMSVVLSDLAKATNGTYACASNRANVLIDKGHSLRVTNIAVVGDNNKVYYATGTKEIEDTEDDSSIGFKIKTPISEWLNDHMAIKMAIQPLPLNEKMDYIGKWLISNRLTDAIDSEEFQDIFRQAGLIGYTDPKVLQFYKLFS